MLDKYTYWKPLEREDGVRDFDEVVSEKTFGGDLGLCHVLVGEDRDEIGDNHAGFVWRKMDSTWSACCGG